MVQYRVSLINILLQNNGSVTYRAQGAALPPLVLSPERREPDDISRKRYYGSVAQFSTGEMHAESCRNGLMTFAMISISHLFLISGI